MNEDFDIAEMQQEMDNNVSLEPEAGMGEEMMPEDVLAGLENMQQATFISSILSASKAQKAVRHNMRYFEKLTGEKYNLV